MCMRVYVCVRVCVREREGGLTCMYVHACEKEREGVLCVCVCERERERERKRKREKKLLCVNIYMCV